MISYAEVPVANESNRKFFDIVFFENAAILECARLNQDLRFTIDTEVALATFKQFRSNPEAKVHLFETSKEMAEQFRSTFYLEPCLKVHVQSLTSRQLRLVLQSTHCTRGIVECNDFFTPVPNIRLSETVSAEQLLNFKPPFKRGRILLYDIEKNRDVMKYRYPSRDLFGMKNAGASEDQPSSQRNLLGSHSNSNSSKTEIRCQASKSDVQPSNYLLSHHEHLQAEVDAQEFTNAIQNILNAPMSSQNDSTQEHADQTDHMLMIRHDNKLTSTPAAGRLNSSVTDKDTVSPPRGSKTSSRKKATSRRKNKHDGKTVAQVQTRPPESNQNAYLHIFERLFRSFRQQVFEYFGEKCENVIAHAERKVQLLSPDFDCRALTDETASSTLEVIEEIVKEASFMKRSKLRHAALTLISDIYNKHYSLLEQHRAIDKVEEIYYRLKR